MGKVDLFGGRVSTSRTSKALCVITAGVAFVLGTVLGVLIPLYVLPPLSTSAEVAAGPQTVVQDYVSSRSNLAQARPRRPPVSVPPRPVMPAMSEVSDVMEVVAELALLQPSPPPPPPPAVASLPTNSTAPPSTSTSTAAPERAANATAGAALLTDGMFWSSSVEAALPTGFSDAAVQQWRDFVRHSALVKVEAGCGRMQNRLLTFENGTRSCCRYRQNFDQIQGEIFSFLLSRQLGIHNLAPTSLMRVQPANWQWSAVRSQLNLAQWAADRPVVLTRFQPQLELAYIPETLRDANRRLHPVDLALHGLSLDADRVALVELAQWSDLIVFDYLTANLDRIVNNLYNQQWNPSMMEAPAHNLARDAATGLLLFLDNESGLLHGYRLLDKYESYHRTMLDATCVFRRRTVDAVRRLHRDGDVGQLLRRAFRQTHPELLDYLPTLPEKSIKILNARIANVHEVMERCDRTYGR